MTRTSHIVGHVGMPTRSSLKLASAQCAPGELVRPDEIHGYDVRLYMRIRVFNRTAQTGSTVASTAMCYAITLAAYSKTERLEVEAVIKPACG
jgi:hypothetical protein